tara:strand:- start:32335 stop:32934 length:600 start_codon:yes stop_codon:yes gene_type:complete
VDFWQARQQLLTEPFALSVPARVVEDDFASRRAAVLLAVMNIDGQADLLLTQRAAHLTLHPSEIAFPGGKPEPEDGDDVATALREAYEEVALPPAAVTYLGQLNRRVTRSGFSLSPCVALVENSVNLKANANEVAAIFTLPLAQLSEASNWQFTQQIYAGRQQLSPQFSCQDYRVQGVTARLIADLMTGFFNVALPDYG